MFVSTDPNGSLLPVVSYNIIMSLYALGFNPEKKCKHADHADYAEGIGMGWTGF